MKKLNYVLMLCLGLLVSGCGQMIADAMVGDRYLKTTTQSSSISARSRKDAVSAAVRAASGTNWSPKTISPETGYVLAEQTPNVKYMDSSRNYTFKLEVQVPEGGKGMVTAKITPPQGMLSDTTLESELEKYFSALSKELSGAKAK